jgi:hypothetical protein
MISWSNSREQQLARCHGFLAVAHGAPVGEVETPLFPPGGDEADYLILRTPLGGRRLVSTGLVREIDADDRVVHLSASAVEIERLPESLPLARAHRRPPPR